MRYALRTMRHSAGVTAVAVLSLALGIGANTAIFTLVDAVFLRMLPVKDPPQLYLVVGSYSGRTNMTWTCPDYRALREHRAAFRD